MPICYTPFKTQTADGIAPDLQSLTSLNAELFLLLRPQYRQRLFQAVHAEVVRPGSQSERHACSGRNSHVEIDPFSAYSGRFDLSCLLKNSLCLIFLLFRDIFRTTVGNQQFAVVTNFFEGGDGFRSKKSTPTIFFARAGKKHEAVRLRLIFCAAKCFMLCGLPQSVSWCTAPLHKIPLRLATKHCSACAPLASV